MNHTGEGHSCSDCGVGKHANGTGFKTCIRCSYLNDWVDDIPHGTPVIGGKCYHMKLTGQQFCRRCKNSGKEGSYGCNENTGEFFCYGLYTPKSRCDRPQKILESILISYFFFLFTTFVVIPIVFGSGSLAVISRQLRKDVQLVLQWMKRSTGKAVVAKMQEELLNEGNVREELLQEYFRVLTRPEFRYSRRPCVALSDMAGIVKEMGISDDFIDMLKSRTGLFLCKEETFLEFDVFRDFLSLIAQRLGYARAQERAFEMYRARSEAKGGKPMLPEDIQNMAHSLGFELGPHEETRLLQLATKGGAWAGVVGDKKKRNSETESPKSPKSPKSLLTPSILKLGGKRSWMQAAKQTLQLEEEPKSPKSPKTPDSPHSPSAGPRAKHIFHVDLFSRATHVLAGQRFVDELLMVRQRRHATLRAAFDTYSKVELGNDRSEPYLAAKGFRYACMDLSLTWDFELLNDVIFGARGAKKRGILNKLLQKLESEFYFAIVAFVICSELMLKAMQFRWASYLLMGDYLARVLLHIALRIGPAEFCRRRDRKNLRDLVIVAGEVSYWFIVDGGNANAERLHVALSKIIKLEHVVRCFRLLRFSTFIIPGLRLLIELLKVVLIIMWIPSKYLCRNFCKRCCCGCCCSQEETSHSLELKRKPKKSESACGAWYRCCGPRRQPRDEVMVTYESFRRYKSAYDAKHNAHFWPLSQYRDAFRELDPACSGTIDLENLGEFLGKLGFDSSGIDMGMMKDLVSVNDGKRLVFFDDMLAAMAFLRTEDYETSAFLQLYSRRLHAQRSLVILTTRVIKTILTIIGEFLTELIKLAANLFILASSLFGKNSMQLKLEQFASALYGIVSNSPLAGILGPIFALLGPFLALLRKLAALLAFEFDMEGGVTCQGVMSLLFLPVIYAVVAIIVLVFDSAVFVFLKVSMCAVFVPCHHARSR